MGVDQDVGGSETDDGVLEVEGATVVPGIVAHHLPDGYSVAGIELGGAGQEASTGVPFLIGEHLRISQPGMVIDGRMDAVETNPTVYAVPDSMVAACLSSPAPQAATLGPGPGCAQATVWVSMIGLRDRQHPHSGSAEPTGRHIGSDTSNSFAT